MNTMIPFTFSPALPTRAIEIYVDLGYYSYIWGSGEMGSGLAEWLTFMHTTRPRFLTEACFLIDSQTSFRGQAFPEYKQRRARRKSVDERSAAVAERVRSFRTGITSPTFHLNWLRCEGYEADDLVALLPTGTRVIGVDKDYAQLSGLTFCSADFLTLDPAARYLEKAAAYVRRILEGRPHNRWFTLVQALFGDRSDSIPRIIAHESVIHSSRILEGILSGDLQVLSTSERKQFLTNLPLVTLPHPSLLSRPYTDGEELYQGLLTGSIEDRIPKSELLQ